MAELGAVTLSIGEALPAETDVVEVHAEVWTDLPRWEIRGGAESVSFAARAEASWLRERAAELQRLSDAGWRLTDAQTPRAFLQASIADAAAHARNAHELPYGWVLDVALPGHGPDAEGVKAGALLVGSEPHDALYPPCSFPAIVVNTITGEQTLVDDEAAARRELLEAIERVALAAKRPSAGASLRRLRATDLLPTLADLATALRSGAAALPAWIDFAVKDDFEHVLNGTIEVLPRRRCVAAGARLAAERTIGYTNGERSSSRWSVDSYRPWYAEGSPCEHAFEDGHAIGETLLADYGS